MSEPEDSESGLTAFFHKTKNFFYFGNVWVRGFIAHDCVLFSESWFSRLLPKSVLFVLPAMTFTDGTQSDLARKPMHGRRRGRGHAQSPEICFSSLLPWLRMHTICERISTKQWDCHSFIEIRKCATVSNYDASFGVKRWRRIWPVGYLWSYIGRTWARFC